MARLDKKEIPQKVEELATPIIEGYGFELVEVEWKPQGGSWNLCLYIDKPGGITIDDCEQISYEVSDLLDRTDFIHHSYNLEVSSPGVERPLKNRRDYERYQGEYIQVSTYQKIKGQKKFYGTLKDFSDENLSLETEEGKILELPFSQIAKVKLWFRPDKLNHSN